MKITIHEDKVKVTPSIKSYIEEKLGRLNKYFEDPETGEVNYDILKYIYRSWNTSNVFNVAYAESGITSATSMGTTKGPYRITTKTQEQFPNEDLTPLRIYFNKILFLLPLMLPCSKIHWVKTFAGCPKDLGTNFCS